ASPAAAQKTAADKPVSVRDRRQAAKLYLAASRQFEQGAFEEAMQSYQRAAELVPDNHDYALAAEVARSHAVTSLVQEAAKARNKGDAAAARAALERARSLDPKNPQVTQHVNELADDVVQAQTAPLYAGTGDRLGEAPRLTPKPGTQSFHLKVDARTLLQRVYQDYGIRAVMDQSVQAKQLRFDIDDAGFVQATSAANMLAGTFAEPLDAHTVVVALNNRQNILQYQHLETETLTLAGLKTEELTEISNIAKNVFGMTQASVSETQGTITLKGAPSTLDAFNQTMSGLMDGRSQVLLDVQIIQLARTHDRNTGAVLPQQVSAFNVYSEEQSILNANQTLVEEIISSGLASADDPLAILGILIAEGAVSGSLFQYGIATIGYGLTWTGIAPGQGTFQLALNSSATKALDNVRVRLSDGQETTLRNGMRYPILTGTYSSGVSSSISGLTSAGTSSALASLLSSLSSSSSSTIPQMQYQDIGLTLKATPKVMRNGDVALTMDMKLTALSGSSNDGIPIQNSRGYSGVITLKAGYGALLMSEISEQESLSLSGIPGLSEIPGLNNTTGKDTAKDYATMIIAVTPHVINGPRSAGRTPMMRIERTALPQSQ
ncbi:MAG TPA: hypothetical protein VN151_08490, partial [Terracidiphilus sp.]|nr:hypothetical protein [Terracidiphilus sp.]